MPNEYLPPGDRALVWVPKEFKEKYDQLGSDIEHTKALEEFLENTRSKVKQEYEDSLKAMNEDALVFEGLFLQTKQRFAAVKDEAIGAAYSVWESYDKEVPRLRERVKEVVDTLKPLTEQLQQIESMIGKVSTFGIDQLNKAVQSVNSLQGQNKEMFEFLVKNFKVETNIEKKSW